MDNLFEAHLYFLFLLPQLLLLLQPLQIVPDLALMEMLRLLLEIELILSQVLGRMPETID